MYPEWLEWLVPFRIVAICLIYAMFFIQLYAIKRTHSQFKAWEEGEAERRARWERDMKEVARMREEAYHLRAQAEVALAQARRHISVN
jgi:hypothetical protein